MCLRCAAHTLQLPVKSALLFSTDDDPDDDSPDREAGSLGAVP